MAANDDLDGFFKKIDRKGNKHKKATGILTNNKELLQQLVIVTSATSAFKENMDLDDEEDEETGVNNQNRRQIVIESNAPVINNDGGHTFVDKSQSYSTSVNNKSKPTTKLSVQDNNNLHEQQPGVGQQDEWEEFEDSNSKYAQMRLKFAPGGNEDEDDDEYYDNGTNSNNHDINTDDTNNVGGDGDEEQSARNNRRREQQKDKPVWKLDQVKQAETEPTKESNDSTAVKVEEPIPPPPSKPATSGAYRPPQLRDKASVTVVSGTNPRPSKKEKPNLASTDDFPTLGAAVNKK